MILGVIDGRGACRRSSHAVAAARGKHRAKSECCDVTERVSVVCAMSGEGKDIQSFEVLALHVWSLISSASSLAMFRRSHVALRRHLSVGLPFERRSLG